MLYRTYLEHRRDSANPVEFQNYVNTVCQAPLLTTQITQIKQAQSQILTKVSTLSNRDLYRIIVINNSNDPDFVYLNTVLKTEHTTVLERDSYYD